MASSSGESLGWQTFPKYTRSQVGRETSSFSFPYIIEAMISEDGDPVNLNIMNSYSISDSPLNMASPRVNSARRHPKAHISTSNE
jgi:hypothetical protein